VRAIRQVTTLTLAATLALALAACSKEPTGQIVAVVNGEEISLTELNDELRDANIPQNADKKIVLRNVLQRVIDRRLLAQAAKEQGVDRDPSYIATQRRMTEQLLVELYAKKASEGVKVPDAAAINKFISENPAMFAQRKLYKLDQVAFDMPANPSVLKQFERDHSIDAVMTTLGRLNIQYQRGAGQLDSATVPAALVKQVDALPPGEPFVVPMNGKVIVSVVTGQSITPVPETEARRMAAGAMRSKGLQSIGESRVKEARAKAKIDYQPDYAPTSGPGATGTTSGGTTTKI
jgi:peptidyl-prolyl cis-trans isomerase C